MSFLLRQYSTFVVAPLLAISLLMPLTATAQLGVLYDETFTGAELNDEVLAGNASYPAADVTTVVNVTRLRLSPASGFGGDPAVILFRMPILAASALSSFNQLKVTVVVDIVRPPNPMDTADLDFGVAVSDGTRGIGGMQGDWGTAISQGINNWSLDAPDNGTDLTGEDFTPNSQLLPVPSLTYVITANLGAAPTVEVTNSEAVPASVLYNTLPVSSAINYNNQLDFLLVGNNAAELYEVKSVSIRVEAGPDGDGDGVADADDLCAGSDLSDMVVVDGCDSGVMNSIGADGCTISDLITTCAVNAKNHGQFVSCVAGLGNELKKDGNISQQEGGAIQGCAASAKLP